MLNLKEVVDKRDYIKYGLEQETQLVNWEHMDARGIKVFRGLCNNCGRINTPYPEEIEIVNADKNEYLSNCCYCETEIIAIPLRTL